MRTIGWHYEEARQRIDALLRPLPDDRWLADVPACPGWRVRDVLAHLVGNTEDGAAGRITGIPTPELTDAQVARHRDDAPLDLLELWSLTGPFVAEAVTGADMWPAAIDAVTHEHDLRGALGDTGGRDTESIRTFASMFALDVAEQVPVVFELDGVALGTAENPDTPVLRTSSFEFFRARMGRRSRDQVLAFDWTGDPGPVLDHFFVFDPSAGPLSG